METAIFETVDANGNTVVLDRIEKPPGATWNGAMLVELARQRGARIRFERTNNDANLPTR